MDSLNSAGINEVSDEVFVTPEDLQKYRDDQNKQSYERGFEDGYLVALNALSNFVGQSKDENLVIVRAFLRRAGTPAPRRQALHFGERDSRCRFTIMTVARRLDTAGTPCNALILAAMLRADPTMRARLSRAFPEVRDELEKRAHARRPIALGESVG